MAFFTKGFALGTLSLLTALGCAGVASDGPDVHDPALAEPEVRTARCPTRLPAFEIASFVPQASAPEGQAAADALQATRGFITRPATKDGGGAGICTYASEPGVRGAITARLFTKSGKDQLQVTFEVFARDDADVPGPWASHTLHSYVVTAPVASYGRDDALVLDDERAPVYRLDVSASPPRRLLIGTARVEATTVDADP